MSARKMIVITERVITTQAARLLCSSSRLTHKAHLLCKFFASARRFPRRLSTKFPLFRNRKITQLPKKGVSDTAKRNNSATPTRHIN